MVELTTSLTNALRADTALASMIGSYTWQSSSGTDTTVPAVFPFSPVPETTTNPVVVVSAALSDIDFGVKRHDVREVSVDVAIYSDADGNIEAVDRPADYIRMKIRGWERMNYAVLYWNVISVEAVGPVGNDQEDLYGRTIAFTFLMERVAA